jgi:hypothetical protein
MRHEQVVENVERRDVLARAAAPVVGFAEPRECVAGVTQARAEDDDTIGPRRLGECGTGERIPTPRPTKAP